MLVIGWIAFCLRSQSYKIWNWKWCDCREKIKHFGHLSPRCGGDTAYLFTAPPPPHFSCSFSCIPSTSVTKLHTWDVSCSHFPHFGHCMQSAFRVIWKQFCQHSHHILLLSVPSSSSELPSEAFPRLALVCGFFDLGNFSFFRPVLLCFTCWYGPVMLEYLHFASFSWVW